MDISHVDAYAGGVVARFSDAELGVICPFHEPESHFPMPDVERALRGHETMHGPCAMRVANESDLLVHAGIALFVSCAHYAIALRERWVGFPHHYCGRASADVMLSLLEHGYPNALVLRAGEPRDHGYVGLPYVMPEERGVIVADPTFGQMPDTDTAVLVTRRVGSVWEYRPGWGDHADMYPDMFLDLDRVRLLANVYRVAGKRTAEFGALHFHKRDDGRKNAAAYLEAAFANPVDVTIPPWRDEILKKLAPW